MCQEDLSVCYVINTHYFFTLSAITNWGATISLIDTMKHAEIWPVLKMFYKCMHKTDITIKHKNEWNA